MKTLNDYINECYINEKLKLSDINRDNIDGRWVDANKLKEKDLEEGNIVLLENGNYYILAKDYIAGKLVKDKYLFKDDYLLIRKNEDNLYGYSFINFTTGYKNFLFHDRHTTFNIVKVYQRKRNYKNTKELKDDLDLLYDGYLVKL